MPVSPVVMTPVTTKYRVFQYDGTNAADIVSHLGVTATGAGITEDAGKLFLGVQMSNNDIGSFSNAAPKRAPMEIPANYYLCVGVWGSAPNYEYDGTLPVWVTDDISNLIEI